MIDNKIVYDMNDHFNIICNDCNNFVTIKKVETMKGIKTSKGLDKCSYIIFTCDNCKTKGHRKIYWNKLEGNKFLYKRAYGLYKDEEVELLVRALIKKYKLKGKSKINLLDISEEINCSIKQIQRVLTSLKDKGVIKE